MSLRFVIMLSFYFCIFFCQGQKRHVENIISDTIKISGFFIQEYGTNEINNYHIIHRDSSTISLVLNIDNDNKSYKYFVPLDFKNKNKLLNTLNILCAATSDSVFLFCTDDDVMTTYNLNSYLNGRCYHFDSIFRANSYVSQGKSVKKFNILYTEALWIRLHLDRSALQMIETSGGSLVKDDANPVTILYPFSYIKTVSNIHFKKRYLKRLN